MSACGSDTELFHLPTSILLHVCLLPRAASVTALVDFLWNRKLPCRGSALYDTAAFLSMCHEIPASRESIKQQKADLRQPPPPLLKKKKKALGIIRSFFRAPTHNTQKGVWVSRGDTLSLFKRRGDVCSDNCCVQAPQRSRGPVRPSHMWKLL